MAAPRQRARLTAPDDEGVQDIDGLTPAEAQEAEASGEFVPVPVGDIKVRVRPQKQWRMSHMRLLNQGDLDGWAESVIHPDDVEDFFDLDVTLAEFQDFAEEAAKATGDDLGKSRGRSKSSGSRRRS
jgi:formylglycine-generating enzyme required for sulfatase activity